MSRTDPSVRLTEEIARQLDQLGDRLSALPAREAAQVLARVLEPDEGVLSRVTALMVAGAHFVKDHAERGALPAEVWLALGRAANELHDIVLDLDEHTDTLRTLHTPPAPAAAPVPTAAPLVVRRHR
ncbi:hypothetical protein RM572_27750 [Streptomyces sp. DSM 42041]|uniref:Uncharacterized protein n=1 Tax=Streptomyces hazeniae TaxID=3075538 RepID=A0ABU2NZY8_9ACTN|nr:hypothetical protein [Streptomyces sp. DSM 42041]MDT0382557.1 hypothetical protein [Streptomyces sp. DSM 42041]